MYIHIVRDASHSLISLTKPLTFRSLNVIRAALLGLKEEADRSSNLIVAPRNAAVLIPFCNVRGHPGILFELRSTSLRSHSGEICFPGGRVDKRDKSFLAGALRESHEELGIAPDRVDVLGEIGSPQLNFRGDMRVWPFVGFVHPESVVSSIQNMSQDDALPSLDLLSLRSEVSSHEVALVFHVPLVVLADPRRHRTSSFRGSLPYITVDVQDVVEDAGGREVGITSLSKEGADNDVNNDLKKHTGKN
ncbi:hypothetical protein H2248_010837 [Termitomyces sp. 'cryptogamus']|nr:hypothetical protein H2248_010837 [Termitomyces sp. 'cryptogamus']